MDKKLSHHFMLSEFACKCGCGKAEIEQGVVDLLEQIRGRFGKPITVNSGYRCAEHNAAIGGKKNSFHMKAMAADIVVEGIPSDTVYAYVLSLKKGGAGRYPTKHFTHIDIGPVRTWIG